LSDSFFPPLYNGAKQAAHDLGISFNYIPINEGDIEQSSAQTMEAAIAEHPSAIVVGDFIPSVVDPLIKKAVSMGIPVYVDQSGQTEWKAAGAFGFVGQQGPVAGAAAGKEFVKLGSKRILCVINVPGNPYLSSVCDGLGGALKAGGGSSSNLLLPTADSTNALKVSEDIGAYLTSHHGFTGVFAENDLVGTAAVSALQTVGMTSKVRVGTLELSKLALDDVQSGKVAFLVNEQPYLDGYYGELFAYQYVKYGLAPVGPVATGPAIIDKSNIGNVLSVFRGYPGVLGSE
jgi:simple sugar transport system substrate-binding protein